MTFFYAVKFKIKGRVEPSRHEGGPRELILEPVRLKLLGVDCPEQGISADMMDVSRDEIGVISSENLPEGLPIEVKVEPGLFIRGVVRRTVRSETQYYSEIAITGLSDSEYPRATPDRFGAIRDLVKAPITGLFRR